MYLSNTSYLYAYKNALEKISEAMKEELETLKIKLKKLPSAKEKLRCKLEWKCNRIFCTMDHNFLFRKCNKKGLVTKSVKNKGFKCDKCGLMVARETQLEVHNRLKHEDIANLNCEHCIFKCRNESQLQEHVKHNHHVPCTKC